MCIRDRSRSATVTVAYIMKQQGLCLGDAYKFVKELRPVISPNLNFMGQLLKYEKNRRNGDCSWGCHPWWLVTLLSRIMVALFWCTRVWYSVDAEILPHTPPLQRLFNREPKTKETIGPHLTFVYTTIENIKYEEVFNNIILSII